VEQDSVALGRSYRLLRKAAGLSGRQVARSIGISASYLSDLELGRRKWNTKIIRAFEKAI
jgi:transcriptional regulator with XRE-family HTH domain